MGNAQDRAKNRYDPMTYPVRFFRRNESDAKKVSLSGFEKRIDTNMAVVKKRNDEMGKQWMQSGVETGRPRV